MVSTYWNGYCGYFDFNFLILLLLKNGGFNEVTSASIQSEPVPTILEEDPESPIHGVSVAELERRSGMPVGGWTPIFNKSYSTASMRSGLEAQRFTSPPGKNEVC